METITLRRWTDGDLEPFAAMNADPEVMRYFPGTLPREQSAASMQRIRDGFTDRGWGLWAVDVDGHFAGFTGLSVPSFEAPFMPCVEVGWRLRPEFWGRGIAYRAACAALDYGFTVLRLPEIVSFTSYFNLPSRRLMERLGMTRDLAGDFDHPKVDASCPIRPHVLYRIGPEHRPPAGAVRIVR